jgi:phage shock protein PspC (stress-responsive transcriptional regulator)
MNEQQPGATSTRFFDWVRGLGLTRTDDRWIAGVCGAVAQRTSLDPLVVRGIAVVIAVLGGPALLAYAVGWALLPDRAGHIHAERAIRGIVEPATVAIGVMIVLTFVPAVQGLWWRGVPAAWGMPGWLSATLGTAWTIALLGFAVWLVVAIARRRADRPSDPGPGVGPVAPDSAYAASAPGPTAPAWTAPGQATTNATGGADASSASRPWQQPYQRDWRQQHEDWKAERRAREAEQRARQAARQPGAGFVAIGLGLAVVAGAAVAAWAQATGLPAIVLGIATALGVLAVATIVAGVRGRESGGLGLFSAIAVVALVVTGVLPAGTQMSLIGGTTWRIESVASGTARNYAMGVGGPTLDLRDLTTGHGGGDVGLWLGAGGATVLLPDDAPVRVQVSGVGYGVSTGPGTEDGDGGVLSTTTVENTAARTAPSREITDVHVWVVGGGVDVPHAVVSEGAGR